MRDTSDWKKIGVTDNCQHLSAYVNQQHGLDTGFNMTKVIFFTIGNLCPVRLLSHGLHECSRHFQLHAVVGARLAPELNVKVEMGAPRFLLLLLLRCWRRGVYVANNKTCNMERSIIVMLLCRKKKERYLFDYHSSKK